MYQIFVSEYAFADFMIQLALEPQLENQAFKIHSYISPDISAFKRMHMMRLCTKYLTCSIDDFRVDVDRCDVRGTFDLVGQTSETQNAVRESLLGTTHGCNTPVYFITWY